MAIKVMLLCKKTLFCEYAVRILESYFPKGSVCVASGDGNRGIDDELSRIEPEYLVSFLSPWIVPKSMLYAAQKAAINFHPGSPSYPGAGCHGFALYEMAKEYGVTCHHMEEKVNSGRIVMTSRFNISPNETLESLKLKSMNHLLFIFERIIHGIYEDDSLPESDEKWLRPPFTKKQFDELRQIDPFSMSGDEMLRRIHASDYGGRFEGAFIEICGKRLYFSPTVDEPLLRY